MLIQEAVWLGEQVQRLDAHRLSPLLDVGSSTAAARTVVQPWIETYLFAPLRRRGIVVKHLDLKAGTGVDIVGDLMQPDLVARLADLQFRAVLCTNLLEHVAEPARVCANLEAIVAAGGYIVVSVPYRFPYHPDPIDNRFRPGIAEVVALFPGCRAVAAEIVDCGAGWSYLPTLVSMLRHVAPQTTLSKRQVATVVLSYVAHLFRRHKVTCVVLRRTPAEQLEPAEPTSAAA